MTIAAKYEDGVFKPLLPGLEARVDFGLCANGQDALAFDRDGAVLDYQGGVSTSVSAATATQRRHPL